MQDKIKNLINEALKNLEIEASNYVVEHPADIAMGDYSTNVAMVYKIDGDKIKEELEKNLPKEITKIEIKNRFINFYLDKKFFIDAVKEIVLNKDFGKNSKNAGKKIMVEYTDPNPFKPFHIGHLMSNSIGESISRLVEYSHADTVRANYQGDVGLHVAKAIYKLREKGKPGEQMSIEGQAEYIGMCYSEASNLYETDENIKKEIDEINKKIYDKSDREINTLYDWGRSVTLEAFEILYKKLGTKFDYYFFESEMAPIGSKIVNDNVGRVFSKSDGAIVFKGEEHDSKLHTRVFITKAGLPTYEAKEIGLTISKFTKEPEMDKCIVITAIEQAEYMKVVQKAISLIHPDYENKMKHVTHGMMRFASGKMSSRKGNVITGESLIKEIEYLIREKIQDRDLSNAEKENIASLVGISALKYSILKQSTNGDIIYDFEKSISFEGDSGPYLQYSTVRANAILKKTITGADIIDMGYSSNIYPIERYLYRFPEVVERAQAELQPHHIATYLTELASTFNTFYNSEKIIDGEDESYKTSLVRAFSIVMQNGLWLLGIETPEKM